MPDPVVRLSSLHLRLTGAAGAVNILRDVSLVVEQGCHLAVIGPSGSGKSSLLALTAGLERPTTGTVEITGRNLAAFDEDELAKFRGRTIGIVFQSFHLIATMTALENVALPLELAGDADANRKARRVLAETGLETRSGHLPVELSASDAECVIVTLEDLWGESSPQNTPGTDTERPNWTRRSALSLERVCLDPGVREAALQMSRGRRNS